MTDNKLVRLLTYVTGLVNQELLLQNEYLAAENRILTAHLPARLRLSDPERSTLAEIGKRLGRKALRQVTCVAKPDTILGWYRKLIARSLMGRGIAAILAGRESHPNWKPWLSASRGECRMGLRSHRGSLGQPRPSRIGSDGRQHSTAAWPGAAPKRSQNTTWKEFIRSHMAVLAGIDFLRSKCSRGGVW